MEQATDASHEPTPEQARAALSAAALNSRPRPRDARVHGLSIAGYGVLIGGLVALSQLTEGTAGFVYVNLAYLVLLMALVGWREARARSAPRHSKRIGTISVAASALLGLVAIVLLNAWGHDVRPQPWQAASAIIAVAAPALLGGWLIWRGPRR